MTYATPMHPPISLYLHFPFCVHKCPYCDFNSYTLEKKLPEEIYIQQLITDLAQEKKYLQERKITSLFLGGGTPSLFSPKALEKLLNYLRQHILCETNLEITIELNPGTVSFENLKQYKTMGINRLSIGIQSFNHHALKSLERIHDADTAKLTIENALSLNFNAINLDLMHGLPNQTLQEALNDLEMAIAYNPAHLSWYELTVDNPAEFNLPSENIRWEIYKTGQALLKSKGYQRYEISAYSRENNFCRHNLNYWSFGDYLGIGAGAHGKITNLKTGEIFRTQKHAHPADYLHDPASKTTPIPPSEQLLEFMLNALRLTQGFPLKWLTSRTMVPIDQINNMLKILSQKKFIIFKSSYIKPTKLGLKFLDDALLAIPIIPDQN